MFQKTGSNHPVYGFPEGAGTWGPKESENQLKLGVIQSSFNSQIHNFPHCHPQSPSYRYMLAGLHHGPAGDAAMGQSPNTYTSDWHRASGFLSGQKKSLNSTAWSGNWHAFGSFGGRILGFSTLQHSGTETSYFEFLLRLFSFMCWMWVLKFIICIL
jgi:hypothetical protein